MSKKTQNYFIIGAGFIGILMLSSLLLAILQHGDITKPLAYQRGSIIALPLFALCLVFGYVLEKRKKKTAHTTAK